MADWYASSVAWTAVTAWAALTTYAVGDIRRQLATPTVGNERTFRVSSITTGISGAAEPTWTLTKAGTTTDSGVTWTECTGNSARQQNGGVTNTWTAPHARIENMISWMAAGDRGFASSDHTQTIVGGVTLTGPGPTCIFMSVDRTTGNIPPLGTDYLRGATVAKTGATFNDLNVRIGWWLGFNFTCGTGTDNFINVNLGNTSGYHRFSDCHATIGGSGGNNVTTIGAGVTAKVRLDNPVFTGGNVNGIAAGSSGSQAQITIYGLTLAGTLPTIVFTLGGACLFELHASDLSNLSASNTLFSGGAGGIEIARAVNCRFNAGMHIVSMSNNNGDPLEIDIVNCSSSAGYIGEKHKTAGDVTTETTITLATVDGGASDNVQKVSHKFITSANATQINPLEGPLIGAWNSTTGSSKTATVEIQSSGTLNNDDIHLKLIYLGNASYPLGTLIDNALATPITGNAAVTTSTATWDAAPATPVKQKLQVTFTPNMVGWIYAQVCMPKASGTVYVNDKLTIT